MEVLLLNLFNGIFNMKEIKDILMNIAVQKQGNINVCHEKLSDVERVQNREIIRLAVRRKKQKEISETNRKIRLSTK